MTSITVGAVSARHKGGLELDNVLPELGFRLDAKPRPTRQFEVSIDAAHLRFHEAQVGVEYRMLMLMKRNLGQACGTEQACRVKDSYSYGRMRNHAHALRGRELADGRELRKPGMRDLRLDDPDAAMRQPRPCLKNGAPFLAAGDRYIDVGGNVRLAIDILRRACAPSMMPRLFSTSLVIAQRNTAWKFNSGKERLYRLRAKLRLPARQAATITT